MGDELTNCLLSCLAPHTKHHQEKQLYKFEKNSEVSNMVKKRAEKSDAETDNDVGRK